ncbi:MAG: isoleucine--tRNA ligase [Actinomycetia bacterium]|nr:isoleucine--tRNA ligase [Actinomycetes bacterium]
MDYRETLNLPTTPFPMRADLPRREPERLAAWQAADLYRALRAARRGRPKFVLHDGPPYANGEIHMGTTLNKVLKDLINRYHLLEGRDVVFVPGYDTHGLPIEMRALRELGVSQHDLDPVRLRAECARTALHYIGVMTEQFRRLGVLGDWEHSYRTLDPAFEAEELRLFARLVERGLIYKDFKTVYWCPVDETALAEAEIVYQAKTSPSIWVAFAVARDPSGRLPAGTQAVIWTTTPWTIPANVAIAYHPEFVYVVLDTDRGPLLVAEALAERFREETGVVVRGRLATVRGEDLAGVVARHPYLDRDVPLLPAGYVTAEQGTGLVHTAPGHGLEDFELGKAFGLPVLQPLDDDGRFYADTPHVGGLFYADANAVVVEVLRRAGRLVHRADIEHQYAHCWRCKNPVVFRATEQWFFRIEGVRQDLLAAVDTVEWVPEWGRERMRLMIADRSDWCLSRQRHWGVPIPAFVCRSCRGSVMSAPFVEHFANLVARHGSGIWWEWSVEQLLPPGGLACPACGGTDLEKEWNVFDVWLDSGATQAAVLAPDPELTWPADMVLEGADQFRGWFNSLLTTAVGWRGQAPYRAVVTHGWVVDGQGRPMHKSLGNVIDPFSLVEQYGADVVRLWVASSDFRGDVRVSPQHMRQIAEVYRKIRNTFRFLLGNLADFDSERRVAPEAFDPLDAWAMVRLAETLERARAAYRAYEFHVLVHEVNRFCTVDLSAFYLDVVKDRLYTLAPDDPKRRATQTVLWWLVQALVRVVAPILPFTADEVWELVRRPSDPPSVAFATWPDDVPRTGLAPAAARVEALRPVREAALVALEAARQARSIGNALEAELAVQAPPELAAALTRDRALALEMLMVAAIEVEPGPALRVEARPTALPRCERCWRHVPDVSAAGICGRCAAVLERLPQAGAADLRGASGQG